ncbi:F-box/FBD/LRR-repeat protein At3g26920-like [Rutidosis leptorrhynchoides]|uniref:F-box/FBD/LRR-repeat protein At3g26920-like n=1 Tax=Rutidosis leptorrhynchoides TaxID=125765 RepID=UPI003A99FAF2
MDFDHNNVRASPNEDRLSDLPLELILQILTRVDTKIAIQICLLLIPRWKLIWTSMPYLNFSSIEFKTLAKFSKFLTHVLSQRNHQVEVSSVNLCLHGEDTEDNFVREILKCAFSHNVQELILDIRLKNEFRPYFLRSKTLKHLTVRTFTCDLCVSPKTQWDLPALTTLYLDDISLCDDKLESIDPFSKFVNLQNLTLEFVRVKAKVFEIIAPRLSNLKLINFRSSNVIKVISHQLENLTIIDCSIDDLNIPSGFSSLYYQAYHPRKWLKDRFHSTNKVTVIFPIHCPIRPYRREDAHDIINVLQELHSARFLTLNLDIVEVR